MSDSMQDTKFVEKINTGIILDEATLVALKLLKDPIEIDGVLFVLCEKCKKKDLILWKIMMELIVIIVAVKAKKALFDSLMDLIILSAVKIIQPKCEFLLIQKL